MHIYQEITSTPLTSSFPTLILAEETNSSYFDNFLGIWEVLSASEVLLMLLNDLFLPLLSLEDFLSSWLRIEDNTLTSYNRKNSTQLMVSAAKEISARNAKNKKKLLKTGYSLNLNFPPHFRNLTYQRDSVQVILRD